MIELPRVVDRMDMILRVAAEHLPMFAARELRHGRLLNNCHKTVNVLLHAYDLNIACMRELKLRVGFAHGRGGAGLWRCC